MKLDKLNIGLIIGGKSVEHDISILSGLQAYHAIDKEKHQCNQYPTQDCEKCIPRERMYKMSTTYTYKDRAKGD